MGNKRYILSGINKDGEIKESVVKKYPNNLQKTVFGLFFKVKVVKIYKAKLNLIESKEIKE